MALLGNRSVLLKSPGRFFGGSTVSDNRSNFGTQGSTRGRYFGGFPQTNATPQGYRPPYSWIIAIKNGEMSSTNQAVMSVSPSANGAMGLPGTATAAFTIDFATATGGLISSGTGTASFAITSTATVLATRSGDGSASFAINTNTPLLGALGWVTATGAFSVSATMQSYARGYMSGSTVDTSTVVNANIVSVNGYSVTGNGQTGSEWGPA